MKNKRYKPLVDGLFGIIFIPTAVLTAILVAISVYSLPALIITICVAAIVLYLLISPLFGYVELRDKTLFIKYGFILKKEIPYTDIREISKERKFYSDSMMALKNSFDHINIKYNTFDVTAVSVIENDVFVKDLNSRLSK